MDERSPSDRRDAPQAASNLSRRVARGGVAAVAGMVAGQLASLAQFAVLGRYLRVEGFGVLMAAFSVAQLGITFASQGANVAVWRFVGEDDGSSSRAEAFRSLLRRSVLLVLAGAVLVDTLLLAWSRGWLSWSVSEGTAMARARPYAGWVAAWILLAPLVHLARGVLQGLKRFGWGTFFEKGVLQGGVAFGVAALWLLGVEGDRLDRAMAVVLMAHLCAIALGFAVLRSWWRSLPKPGRPWPWRRLLGVAWPLGAKMWLGILASQGLVWWLASVSGGEDTGLFGAAQRLAFVVTLPLVLPAAILPSFVAELHAAGRIRELERLVRTVAFLAVLPGAAVGLGLAVFAGPLLALAFGPGFEAGGATLRWLVLGYAMQLLTGPSESVLAMTGHQRPLLWSTVAVLVGAATLAAWAVPRFGAEGAAASFAAFFAGTKVAGWALSRALLGVRTHARAVSPAEAVRRLVALRGGRSDVSE